jgi:hypothetical protein
MHFRTLILLYDFFAGSMKHKEASYQLLLLFYSYSIYDKLFIMRTEIKI